MGPASAQYPLSGSGGRQNPVKLRDSYVLRYSMQMLNRNLQSALVAATLGLAAVSFSSAAAADQLIIKYPGDHPDYVFEAEPHGLIEPFD